MKSWKKILTVPFLAVTLLLLQSVPAMAAVTEADVQAVGKETAAGISSGPLFWKKFLLIFKYRITFS